jgi:hypothetical protein
VGVRVAKGLAQATVAVISGVVDAIGAVIDRITDRFGPDDGTTPENATLRISRTDTQHSDEPVAEHPTLALTVDDPTETDSSEQQSESLEPQSGIDDVDQGSTGNAESGELAGGETVEYETTEPEDETKKAAGTEDGIETQKDTAGSKEEADMNEEDLDVVKDVTKGSEEESEVTEPKASTTTQTTDRNTTATDSADPSGDTASGGHNE